MSDYAIGMGNTVGPEHGDGANRIIQYRPAFFSGFENDAVRFDTVEQLLAIPWVQGFTRSHGDGCDFHRFGISPYPGRNPDEANAGHLMAEYGMGFSWWVVGTIADITQVALPAWVPQYDPFEQAREAEATRVYRRWLVETPEGQQQAARSSKEVDGLTSVLRAGLTRVFSEMYMTPDFKKLWEK